MQEYTARNVGVLENLKTEKKVVKNEFMIGKKENMKGKAKK